MKSTRATNSISLQRNRERNSLLTKALAFSYAAHRKKSKIREFSHFFRELARYNQRRTRIGCLFALTTMTTGTAGIRGTLSRRLPNSWYDVWLIPTSPQGG